MPQRPVARFMRSTGMMAVPTVVAKVLTGQHWVQSIYINNTTGASIAVGIQEDSGFQWMSGFILPANSNVLWKFDGQFCDGLSWVASGPGLTGSVQTI